MNVTYFTAICIIRQTGADHQLGMNREIEFLNVIPESVGDTHTKAVKLEETISDLVNAARKIR